MKLPGAERAFIDREKLTDHLLSTEHPMGAEKARVFAAIGYGLGTIELFERRLLEAARNHHVVAVLSTTHGTKYVLPTPREKEEATRKRMKEHALVVLKHPVEEHGLEPGDVGTVVHEYADRAAVEVEFTSADAHTIAVLTLDRADVRQLERGEILHARRRLAPR